MLVFGATLCVGEVVVCAGSPSSAAAGHLPAMAGLWGALLPVALVVTPLLPEPPEEVAAERILGDPGAELADFTAGYRCAKARRCYNLLSFFCRCCIP